MREPIDSQIFAHKSYELKREFSRFDGYEEVELADHDAWLTHFPGRENYSEYENFSSFFWEPQPLNFPERIEFECMGSFLLVNDPKLKRVTDYPSNRENWPIMSKRMLNALLSVGNFPHQEIPIVMIDSAVEGSKEFDENHDFVAIQLLEHLDIFDWEKSIYKRHPRIENCVKFGTLEKLALEFPITGYPPLFRVTTLPTYLFVSGQGRLALEQALIKGVRLVDLEYFRY
jgi:hypothetical protein